MYICVCLYLLLFFSLYSSFSLNLNSLFSHLVSLRRNRNSSSSSSNDSNSPNLHVLLDINVCYSHPKTNVHSIQLSFIDIYVFMHSTVPSNRSNYESSVPFNWTELQFVFCLLLKNLICIQCSIIKSSAT